MKHLKYIICAVPLMFAFGLRAGQADSVVTLEHCIELTLANNATERNAANDTRAAIELRKEAFTKYFPEVSASGMAFWTHNDVFQYNILDIVEIGFINKGKMAGVQALQPVFMGGQIVNGNKLAEVGEDVATLRQQQSRDELRLTAESLYWKLVTLKATREALEAAIVTLDTLDSQVNVAVEAGVAMPNDLLKVRLKRNTYRTEKVDLDNGIKLVKMLLGQYMGQGVAGNFDVAGAVPDSVPEFPLDLYMSGSDALPMT
ncbi:MAG: TolC family protein, partial [Muribaculaceae bacterium]|nr:TolC family protein [Muribaculaceae bacterium]